MEQLRKLLEESINEQLYQMILSNARDKEAISKAKVRPVMLQKELYFQISRFVGKQVLHQNCTKAELVKEVFSMMKADFKQIEIETMSYKATGLISKKGTVTIKKKRHTEEKAPVDMSHNRSKQYILQEGTVVDFLVDLGVQTKEGKIVKSKYDKFRQINRYLELVEDIMLELPKDRAIQIIDFGCGKSYLTFALYYYMHILQKRDVNIIGLDLKEDVIRTCNALKDKYGYNKLRFIPGDISSFEDMDNVDMVVTLHACDTATDYAIAKAVAWDAKVIFAVPCCQHEVNKQIENEMLAPVLKYGLLKERISALLTDGIRANLLEQMGYDTQVVEFIDMEHTPKNVLIRGVKKREASTPVEALQRMEEALHIKSTLEQLL
ncbi:MAG: SAM-dependent methyltransferase [Lachnospiraceae bacterium]|nr:SAM-dependent methyltransferase [Lachnospiraceae bacterium]